MKQFWGNQIKGRMRGPVEALSGIAPLDYEGLKYWIALSRLRVLNRVGVSGLLQRFPSPSEIFKHPDEANLFSSALAKAIRDFDAWSWVEGQIELMQENGVRAITFGDSAYPALLRHIPDPPCMLFAKGIDSVDIDEKAHPVAVVGTRYPSEYGTRMATGLGRGLASMGVCLVSGMARGCDTAGHKGALSSGGFTVAVLGTGVDVVYPPESGRLYDEISEKGLLLSELPMGTHPAKHNFPARNRIIAGMSLGVVVVEAPLRSGSLMTARLGLEYGRDVMAVPGQAVSDRCAGANKLIKDGAYLVENAGDILSALGLEKGQGRNMENEAREKADLHSNLHGDERLIWCALDIEPLHIDRLLEKTGLGVARVSELLLEMEFKGLVRQLPGKCFAKGL